MLKSISNRINSLPGFNKRAGSSDFMLVILTTVLVIFGTVMVFSASYYFSLYSTGSPYGYLIKQVVFAVIGFGLMYGASKMDYHVWQRYSAMLMGGSILLLMLVLVIGTNVNGATRWIRLGPLSIMPGEIAKFTVILMVSAYFSKDDGKIQSFKEGILPVAALMIVVCGLIALQPNLSTMLTIVGITFGIMVVAGLPRIWLRIFATAVGAVVVFVFFADEFLRNTNAYWAKRITSFLNPFADSGGDGYQVVQSLLALGTGGFKGLGLGKSIQKNLYLPEPQNDFILSIIGEELGFIGIAALMIVFVLLIWRCMKVALHAPDRFGMLVASGCAIMIGLQVVFNIAVVTSSMPPTGVALPFISYGGNALWICMIEVGVVLNISRHVEDESVVEQLRPRGKRASAGQVNTLRPERKIHIHRNRKQNGYAGETRTSQQPGYETQRKTNQHTTSAIEERRAKANARAMTRNKSDKRRPY